eukprot:CAMPEP_0113854284 /NCGR_PEP_ID=MMETSP0372-20130328/7195_1 /TAXON_ID=340204 /ORGANISM="Lankesteria abbotti" /LENGTH=371 /DNA_ID=CAMNT_0000827357 /DNA_START=1 /DNA_END=1116 /DNA_ORIENTATION=+ /assembly_acc=CAM_ASM_000359
MVIATDMEFNDYITFSNCRSWYVIGFKIATFSGKVLQNKSYLCQLYQSKIQSYVFLDGVMVDVDGNDHSFCKALLMAVSPTALTDCGDGDKQIQLKEDSETVKSFIDWVHTGVCGSPTDGVKRLLEMFGCGDKVDKSVIKPKPARLLLDRKVGTDVVLVSETGRRDRVHWAALASCGTDHFVKMKTSGMCETVSNEVEVGASGIAMHWFVQWLYTDKLDFIHDAKAFADLYSLAELWNINSLQLLLRGHLTEIVSGDWSEYNRSGLVTVCGGKFKVFEAWKCSVVRLVTDVDLLGAALARPAVVEKTVSLIVKNRSDNEFLNDHILQGWLAGVWRKYQSAATVEQSIDSDVLVSMLIVQETRKLLIKAEKP